ncbi:MAG: hypothetical protein ABEI86_01925 [Halobacteriaceae archaeon]
MSSKNDDTRSGDTPNDTCTDTTTCLPADLRNRDQWLCWQYGKRTSTKSAKIPLNPRNGNKADLTNPEVWGSYADATAKSNVDGIGFVFSSKDPYVGVDLDDCVAEDGSIEGWAEQVVDQLNSYTEYSPSGSGLHVIVRGELSGTKNRKGNIEIYDSDRYFTVTGDHLSETPSGIETRQNALDSIYAEHLATEEKGEEDGGDSEQTISDSSRSSVLSDEQLLKKARNAKKGEKFQRLWNGDSKEYESPSEEDIALCSRLAYWSNGDRKQIDRLFRRSNLMRSKWDEQRGEQTYGELTIENALETVNERYNPTNMQNSSDSLFGSGSTIGQNRNEQQDESETYPQSLEKVKKVVVEEFDQETWKATEAVLSAHATLLLSGSTGTGLVIVGPSSSGKTTVLEFIEGDNDMVYRSDDVTPSAFVSHDASKEEDELADIDLIPRIKQKTLLSRDMATWFAGEQEDIRKRMSIMTNLLDGDGYTRDSGTHGKRGYTGRKFRFNYIGASTPLPTRAWKVMGNVGARLVFYEKNGQTDVGKVVDDLMEGSDYHEKLRKCQSAVGGFLQDLWDETGGFGAIEAVTPESEKVKQILEYLIKIVRRGRSILTGDSTIIEGPQRIGATLLDIAKGHALLEGRTTLRVEDMEVCARIALSTMHQKRRKITRALLNPDNDGVLVAKDVEKATGVSRPTAHTRMELLDTLGFGRYHEREGDDRETKTVTLNPELEWPDPLPFPEF